MEATAFGYAQAASVPVAPQLVATTISQVQDITEILCGANGTLQEARGRLFGPWPESGANSKLREASSGQAAELSVAIDKLRS